MNENDVPNIYIYMDSNDKYYSFIPKYINIPDDDVDHYHHQK